MGGNKDPADSWKVHWIDFQVSDGPPGRISVSVRFMESEMASTKSWAMGECQYPSYWWDIYQLIARQEQESTEKI